MLKSHFVAGMFSVGMMVLGAGAASGQNYPNKPIRMVTSAAGGGADITARIIAQGLTSALGQSVIVENRASETTPTYVASATPDGYTLLVTGTNFWTGPLLQKMPYDPVKDFSPISIVERSPSILVVHPLVPVKSVKELIALAKAKPGELNVATTSTGASAQLAAELFKSMAGISMVGIPYKGTGPGVLGLIGGQVQLMFSSIGAVTPHVKAGRLRALAVTSAEPSVLAPGLPPVAATLPGYETVAAGVIYGPAKIPRTIVNRLNQEIVRVLNTAEVKEKFFNVGSETVGSSPEELAAYVKSEMVRVGKVIKDAGIHVD